MMFPVDHPFTSRESALAYLDSELLTCLICGKAMAVLGKHISVMHQVSVPEYQVRYGLPLSRGLTGTRARKAMQANAAGNPNRIGHGAPRHPTPALGANPVAGIGRFRENRAKNATLVVAYLAGSPIATIARENATNTAQVHRSVAKYVEKRGLRVRRLHRHDPTNGRFMSAPGTVVVERP